jgi:hypothetical protein
VDWLFTHENEEKSIKDIKHMETRQNTVTTQPIMTQSEQIIPFGKWIDHSD